VTFTRQSILTATLLAAIGLTGCTQSSAGTPVPDGTSGAPETSGSTSSSGPSSARPRDISLDGKDPCGLISQADWTRFHIERPGQVGENPNFKSPQCYYPGTDAGFNITLVVTEGIGAWADRNVKIEHVDPIEGFPTTTMANNVDERACYAAVDVADEQYLLTTATPDPNDPDQPEKCDLAYQLAESAMKTLVAS
jgi:uncharacterized protein DUF3558